MDNYIERDCTVAVVARGDGGKEQEQEDQRNWQSIGVAEKRGREVNLYKKNGDNVKKHDSISITIMYHTITRGG